MAITIDWATYTINIPRTDLLLLQSTPIEVRQLDLTTFHEVLRDIEDDAAGMPQPVTHNYSAPTEISGVILAQVMEVLDPYSITFEDGQYAVNVTGGNSNIADKVNINNVGIRTANSAGLQDLSSLQAASFTDGNVAVDIQSQYSGLIFPVGTRGYPVNNLDDAHEIAEARGFNTFRIMRSMALASGSYIDGYIFEGDNPVNVTLTLQDLADTQNAVFRFITLTGIFDGNNVFKECNILDAQYVSGFIERCAINGTITLAASSQLSLLDCYSNVAGGGTPIIDFNNQVNVALAVRNYSGGMRITNHTAAGSSISIDMISGRVFIDASCTGGTYIIRGVAEVINESVSPNITIVDETINTAIDNVSTGGVDVSAIATAVWDKPAASHDTEGTFGHYVNYLRYVKKYVFVDTEALVNGNGSQDQPFNNVTDAMDKAEEDHASTIILSGDIILDRNLKNIEIHGVGVPEVDLNGKDVRNARFYQVRLKGSHINAITAQECVLADGLDLNGYFENCAAYGTLNCPVGSVAFIKGVATGLAGASPVTINMNSGGASNLTVVDYHGALIITNCDSVSDVVTVDMASGTLTFDSSCTLGTMVARGACTFVDNSNGATVINETLSATSVWEYTA